MKFTIVCLRLLTKKYFIQDRSFSSRFKDLRKRERGKKAKKYKISGKLKTQLWLHRNSTECMLGEGGGVKTENLG